MKHYRGMILGGSPRQALSLILLTMAAFQLSGCVVGPKYHQPTPPVPAHFKEGGTPDPGTSDIAYSDWWRVFQDPELDRLETEADAANVAAGK